MVNIFGFIHFSCVCIMFFGAGYYAGKDKKIKMTRGKVKPVPFQDSECEMYNGRCTCGNCDALVGWLDSKSSRKNYCGDCGTEVDWSDFE